jgi:uncharacterized protein (DUF885 family)
MDEDAEAAVIKRTLVAAYRQLAEWIDDYDAKAVRRLAIQVERLDGSETTCPCCAETTCDRGCPLASVRDAAG